MRIPSHILYPGLVIALLSMSVVVSITLWNVAHSDGGAQVMPDYYEQAVHWDNEESVRRNSRAMNWSVRFSLEDASQGSIVVHDEHSEPVTGLRGQVHLRRPQYADDLAVEALVPDPETAGIYRFDAPAYASGYWDIVLNAELEGQPIRLSHRQRLP